MKHFKNSIIMFFVLIIFTNYGLISETFNKKELKISDKILAKNKYIAQDINSENIIPNVIQVKFMPQMKLNDANIKGLLSEYVNTNKIKNLQFPYKNKQIDKLLSISKNYGIDRISTIYFNSNIDPTDLSIKLMENDLIEYATPVYKRQFYSTQVNDPYFSQQYALNLIKIADAWDITTGDTNIVIAIVDSGTDINHQDLKSNIFTNWKEIPNNGIDDDHNGKIDDVNGWDFVGNISVAEYQSGIRKEDNNPINMSSFHGTFVAGCASGVTNNAVGIASPGFKTKILPIKCSSDNPQIESILYGYEAIMYAAQMGADVINCSWGGPGGSPSEQDIINTAVSMGSVVVVAAGNDGTFIDRYPTYPSSYKNVINVGASAANDAVAGFTNYGNSVTVYAPGSQILSTMPNNGYSKQDGTSFSTPIISGIVALLKAIHPNWTPMQFMRQLRATADKSLTGTTGYEYLFVGRANAFKAVTYNNPNASSNTTPGILADNILVNNTQMFIADYNKNNIEINIKNYLGATKNLKVKISAIDKYISIENTDITVPMLNTMDSHSINFDVEILKNCPWYEGTAQILLTYQDGEYLDYQVIDIPIKLPTNNKYTNTTQLPLAYNIVPNGCSIPNKNTAWAIGNSTSIGTILYRSYNGISNIMQFGNDPAYAIFGFDENNVMIGISPKSGVTRIQKTSNAGNNWSNINVSNITTFINGIYFYDRNQGILLGDPIKNTWGIAKSIDGGNTWKLVNNVPSPLNGETGYVESIATLGDNIWFGTSIGRIYYSNDRGETWNVSKSTLGSSLSKLAFMDSKIGYALYNIGSGTNQQTNLAYTTDGGINWTTGVNDFSKSGIKPSDIHCVPEANKLILIGNINDTYQSDNNGASWEPLLTQRLDGVAMSKGINDGVAVRLWSFAMSGVGYLDFVMTPAIERKEISSVSDNPYNYGDIKINSSKIGKIEIKNSGNVDLNISDMQIVFPQNADTSEFKLSTTSKSLLKPSETYTLNVIFRPKTKGIKTAKLIISSDAKPKDFQIDLIGNGTEVSDIADEYSNNNIISITPNPAYDKLQLDIPIQNIFNSSYKIINNLGNIVLNANINSNKPIINISELPIGNYIIIINIDNKSLVGKFIKM